MTYVQFVSSSLLLGVLLGPPVVIAIVAPVVCSLARSYPPNVDYAISLRAAFPPPHAPSPHAPSPLWHSSREIFIPDALRDFRMIFRLPYIQSTCTEFNETDTEKQMSVL